MKTWMFLILIGACLVSCQSYKLSPADYIQWVSNPDNGLFKTRQLGEFSLSVQLRPPAMAALQGMRKQASSQQVKQLEAAGKGAWEFVCSFRATESEQSVLKYNLMDQETFIHRVHYLNFEQGNKVYLLTAKDSIQAGFYHFEQPFGLRPDAKATFGFELPDDFDGQATLVWDDQLFGMGPVRFQFHQEDLDQVPDIQF